jgi:hypothetical protein
MMSIILLSSSDLRFAVDAWTEWLCIQQHRNGKITLSSKGREYLAEAVEYVDEDGNENLPSEIDVKKVSHIECDVMLSATFLIARRYRNVR